MKYDNIIIGAGAAGLFVAGELNNFKNLIIEKNKTPGKKIIISGGGRCNFTNKSVKAGDYQSKDKHFHRSALLNYTPDDFIKIVNESNIPFYEKKLGQLFCKNNSKEILNLLVDRINRFNTDWEYNIEITNKSITKTSNGFELSVKGKTLICKNLIIASGGPPMPAIGGTKFSVQIADKFNISVVPFRPALVPIFQSSTSMFSGLSAPVEIKINKKIIKDDLLFTHRGFSGPAILKMTLWAEIDDTFQINWDPENLLKIDQINKDNSPIVKILKSIFPSKLVEYFDQKMGGMLSKENLSKKEKNKLLDFLFRDKYRYSNNEGYRKAEVAKGGVKTTELYKHSMEAKKIKGLYFIGEAVDITGLLGGYNFQWAWSSAFMAAQDIKLTNSSSHNVE